jgi:hypothetical protein
LRSTGEQYNRALQDLVNHVGGLLGFKVEYGRYQGIQNQIGFDGHWVSPKTSYHIAVEVKTTEVYPIKTSTLIGYINELISEGKIPAEAQSLVFTLSGDPTLKLNNSRTQ